MKSYLVLALFLQSSLALAVSELSYQSEMKEKVWPLLERMPVGSFTGQKGVAIHYRTLLQEGAKNCLVILPGRTEPLEKYTEVVYDLLNSDAGANLNFFLMDHRGQGSSGRMVKNPEVGYVDKFQNYVDDVKTFLNKTVDQAGCEKKFLLAHSLGAGIGYAYATQNPNYFDKMALTSPMLKIQTKPYPYPVARLIVDTSILLGQGGKFAVGQTGFDPNLAFAANQFTSSPERFVMAMEMFKQIPEAKLGGVSSRWVLQVMKGTKPLRKSYANFKTPLRVFMAGIETYSDTKQMQLLCEKAKDCKSLMLETSKHEILMDRDVNRDPVIKELESFFN